MKLHKVQFDWIESWKVKYLNATRSVGWKMGKSNLNNRWFSRIFAQELTRVFVSSGHSGKSVPAQKNYWPSKAKGNGDCLFWLANAAVANHAHRPQLMTSSLSHACIYAEEAFVFYCCWTGVYILSELTAHHDQTKMNSLRISGCGGVVLCGATALPTTMATHKHECLRELISLREDLLRRLVCLCARRPLLCERERSSGTNYLEPFGRLTVLAGLEEDERVCACVRVAFGNYDKCK